jgi:uncharacterized protein Usg
MDTQETELMLQGYGLTTAQLYYRMPDYQRVLNTYLWQEYDLAPDYPKRKSTARCIRSSSPIAN